MSRRLTPEQATLHARIEDERRARAKSRAAAEPSRDFHPPWDGHPELLPKKPPGRT